VKTSAATNAITLDVRSIERLLDADESPLLCPCVSSELVFSSVEGSVLWTDLHLAGASRAVAVMFGFIAVHGNANFRLRENPDAI
jgi:hypothetical protein